MSFKSRVIGALGIIGVLCWVIVLVRVFLLSVAVGCLEYGVAVLGAVLVVIAGVLWQAFKGK
jgi:hypothetical protein